MCTSFNFIVECALILFRVKQSFHIILDLVRMGFVLLRSQSARINIEEGQYAHDAALNPHMPPEQLLTMTYLRRVSILISAIVPDNSVPDMVSYEGLCSFLRLTDAESHLDDLLSSSTNITLPMASAPLVITGDTLVVT